jgi:hypothetical protein
MGQTFVNARLDRNRLFRLRRILYDRNSSLGVQGTRPTLLLFCYQQSKLTIAKNLTFAHIGAAADLALMLWTAGINPAIQLKKT